MFIWFNVNSGLLLHYGLKKDGFLKRTRLDGFSGTVDIQMGDEFKILMKFKYKGG